MKVRISLNVLRSLIDKNRLFENSDCIPELKPHHTVVLILTFGKCTLCVTNLTTSDKIILAIIHAHIQVHDINQWMEENASIITDIKWITCGNI